MKSLLKLTHEPCFVLCTCSVNICSLSRRGTVPVERADVNSQPVWFNVPTHAVTNVSIPLMAQCVCLFIPLDWLHSQHDTELSEQLWPLAALGSCHNQATFPLLGPVLMHWPHMTCLGIALLQHAIMYMKNSLYLHTYPSTCSCRGQCHLAATH